MTPEGLLEVARSLLSDEGGRPRHADLRRAVSTAYYALFTALTGEVARLFPPDLQVPSRRLVKHTSAREVLEPLTRPGARIRWIRNAPSCHEDLRMAAEQFVTLQFVRQQADYDHTYRPSKSDTLDAIDRAEEGIDLLRNSRETCLAQLQMVCLVMIADKSARRRMVWRP